MFWPDAEFASVSSGQITGPECICFCFNDSTVRQNQFDKLCNSERGWAFERIINGALEGYDHKKLDSVETRGECARLCLLVTFYCYC